MKNNVLRSSSSKSLLSRSLSPSSNRSRPPLKVAVTKTNSLNTAPSRTSPRTAKSPPVVSEPRCISPRPESQNSSSSILSGPRSKSPRILSDTKTNQLTYQFRSPSRSLSIKSRSPSPGPPDRDSGLSKSSNGSKSNSSSNSKPLKLKANLSPLRTTSSINSSYNEKPNDLTSRHSTLLKSRTNKSGSPVTSSTTSEHYPQKKQSLDRSISPRISSKSPVSSPNSPYSNIRTATSKSPFSRSSITRSTLPRNFSKSPVSQRTSTAPTQTSSPVRPPLSSHTRLVSRTESIKSTTSEPPTRHQPSGGSEKSDEVVHVFKFPDPKQTPQLNNKAIPNKRSSLPSSATVNRSHTLPRSSHRSSLRKSPLASNLNRSETVDEAETTPVKKSEPRSVSTDDYSKLKSSRRKPLIKDVSNFSFLFFPGVAI